MLLPIPSRIEDISTIIGYEKLQQADISGAEEIACTVYHQTGSIDSIYLLFLISMFKSDLESAGTLIKEAARITENNQRGHIIFGQAIILSKAGKNKKAIELIKKAKEIDQDFPRQNSIYSLHLALLQSNAQMYPEAMKNLEEYLSILPMIGGAKDLYAINLFFAERTKDLRHFFDNEKKKDCTILKRMQLSDYLRKTGKISVIEPAEELQATPLNIFGITPPPSISWKKPEIYYGQIFDAQIIGGSSFILTKKNALLDDHVLSEKYVAQHSDNGFYAANAEYYCHRLSAPAEPISLEQGIFLAGAGSNNYYHWMFEYIARLRIIDSINIEKKIPILIDRQSTTHPQFMEILSYINFEKRDIIILDPLRKYTVKTLTALSPVAWLSYKKAGSLIYAQDPKTVPFIVEKTRKLIQNPASKNPERIYVSRKHAATQRIILNNHDLEKILQEYNFVTVFPEQLSVKDQINLFSNAKILIGDGSGLLNHIFSPPGCKIICLLPEKGLENQYNRGFDIVKKLHQEMVIIGCQQEEYSGTSSDQDNITVELKKIRSIIDKFINH